MAENKLELKTSSFKKYAWTSAWVIVGLLVGIIIVLCFSYCQNLCSSAGLLWSFAYFFAGGLAGFIFGVPKIINADPQNQTVQEIGVKRIIQENTNLTQISDWLTKVIIGVGLVEMKEIPGFIMKVAKRMGQGIVGSSHFSSVDIFCAGIILYFSVWGFISGYLVMRIVIAELLAET
jgi:hypothetical protein